MQESFGGFAAIAAARWNPRYPDPQSPALFPYPGGRSSGLFISLLPELASSNPRAASSAPDKAPSSCEKVPAPPAGCSEALTDLVPAWDARCSVEYVCAQCA
jgi:hypothetical protein